MLYNCLYWMVSIFHLSRCSNTYRSHHFQRSKLNFCIFRVAEMSQKAETAGTGANEQEETTASESSTQVKNLVANAVKECLADITAGIAATVNDTIERKFMSFERQFIDESANSVESALSYNYTMRFIGCDSIQTL